MEMKEVYAYIAGVVVVLLIVAAIVYGIRVFNNVVTPITVHEVEQGVKCAVMTTTDGAAISCWKI